MLLRSLLLAIIFFCFDLCKFYRSNCVRLVFSKLGRSHDFCIGIVSCCVENDVLSQSHSLSSLPDLQSILPLPSLSISSQQLHSFVPQILIHLQFESAQSISPLSSLSIPSVQNFSPHSFRLHVSRSPSHFSALGLNIPGFGGVGLGD